MNLAIAINRLSDLKEDQLQLSMLLKKNMRVKSDAFPLALPEDLLLQYDENQKEIARLSHNIYVTNFNTVDEEGVSITRLLCRERVLTLLMKMVRFIDKDSLEQMRNGQELLAIVSEERSKCSGEALALRHKINVLNWKTELIEEV